MRKLIPWLLLSVILVSGCTSMKPVQKDPITGYFPTNVKANVITNKKFDLDSRKNLVAIGAKDEFMEKMINNIGYFDNVTTFEQLQKDIIKDGYANQVPSLNDLISLHNAAKKYKKFLIISISREIKGSKPYATIKITDPITAEEIFVADTYMDFAWTGVNDQNNWYPLFNGVIYYIEENSKTYKK